MTERILTSFGVARRTTPALVASLAVFALFAAGYVAFGFKILLLAFGAALAAALVLDLTAAFVLATVFLLLQHVVLASIEEDSLLQRVVTHADDLVLLLLACAAPFHSVRSSWIPRPARVPLAALGGALLVGAAGAWAHGPLTLVTALDAFSLSKPFLVLFAAMHLPVDEHGAGRALQGITLLALGLAAFGFLDLVAPSITHGALPFAGPMAWRGGHRCLVSVFPNEGMSGWFFAAAACLPLAGWVVRRRRADLLPLLVLLLASLLSYRRKPVVGLALALGVVLLLHGGRARLRLVLVVALVLAIGIPAVGEAMSASFYDAYLGYLMAPDPMQVARNALYIAGWRIAVDHFPIGAGLGLFGGAASTIDYSEFYSLYGLDRVWGLTPDAPRFINDAFYPHLVGGLGFVGTGLYLLALVLPLVRLMSVARRRSATATQILVLAAVLVYLEALAEAIVAPVFETTLPAFFVFTLAGAALARGEAVADELPVEASRAA